MVGNVQRAARNRLIRAPMNACPTMIGQRPWYGVRQWPNPVRRTTSRRAGQCRPRPAAIEIASDAITQAVNRYSPQAVSIRVSVMPLASTI